MLALHLLMLALHLLMLALHLLMLALQLVHLLSHLLTLRQNFLVLLDDLLVVVPDLGVNHDKLLVPSSRRFHDPPVSTRLLFRAEPSMVAEVMGGIRRKTLVGSKSNYDTIRLPLGGSGALRRRKQVETKMESARNLQSTFSLSEWLLELYLVLLEIIFLALQECLRVTRSPGALEVMACVHTKPSDFQRRWTWRG
ncbi:hypothetical protein BKA70DRAFT_1214896 [Coprinopsis sp. MPI-PUGE-AT-0042]|nr:hypothetical protein BKA70DRAFT_1214896 [Coprinopsis sp. MPI-PUGE-AT-0042]